jgi:hypothetical protein
MLVQVVSSMVGLYLFMLAMVLVMMMKAVLAMFFLLVVAGMLLQFLCNLFILELGRARLDFINFLFLGWLDMTVFI